MLSRRRMAFSHVIYTSGFFFLTIAFALIAVVALTLRFAGGPQVLKVAVGPADGDNAKLIGRLRGILSAMAAALDLLFFLSMIWHKPPKPLNKDAPISPSFAAISLFRRTARLSSFCTTTLPSSPRPQAPQSLR
jgi:hypothetical protein